MVQRRRRGKGKATEGAIVVDGLTHADLYDHVDVAGPKLVEFFGEALV